MPSLDRPFDSFRAAGTNGRLDFSLSWDKSCNPASYREKYGLGPGCHAWPRRVLLLSGEAQLTGYLKRLTGGLLA